LARYKAKRLATKTKSGTERAIATVNRELEVMSQDEEKKLLEACADDRPRAHLRPLIIAALDTGARKGELLSLTWKDVDLASGIITRPAVERYVIAGVR
jgi:integrase